MSKTDTSNTPPAHDPGPPPAPANTVTLETPITRGEQTIEQITLRKPKTGELRGIALADLLRLDVTALQTLLPRISVPTLTTADIANLDPADCLALGAEVVGFFASATERMSLSQGM